MHFFNRLQSVTAVTWSDLTPAPIHGFAQFRDEGRFEKINHALVMLVRERIGRHASPTGVIIDSQSVKTTKAGGPRGYDAGKKINGRKRHALVDTDGRELVLEPHPASIQDRDGGGPFLCASRRIFPFIERVFADSGYAGEKVAEATMIAVKIVGKKPARSDSPFSRGAGSSRGSSLASDEIADSLRTSKPPSTPHAPSSTPRPLCSSRVALHALHDFRNQLLTVRQGFRAVSSPRSARCFAVVRISRNFLNTGGACASIAAICSGVGIPLRP